MDIFTKQKAYKSALTAMVLLNIGLLLFMLYEDSNRHQGPKLFPAPGYRDVSQILKKKLNLSEKQAEQINNLRIEYYENETALTKIIRDERDSMNQAMFNKNTNEPYLKGIAARVAGNEYKMELLRIEQANRLKKLCTPEQMEKFSALVLEIRDYFRPDNQPTRK